MFISKEKHNNNKKNSNETGLDFRTSRHLSGSISNSVIHKNFSRGQSWDSVSHYKPALLVESAHRCRFLFAVVLTHGVPSKNILQLTTQLHRKDKDTCYNIHFFCYRKKKCLTIIWFISDKCVEIVLINLSLHDWIDGVTGDSTGVVSIPDKTHVSTLSPPWAPAEKARASKTSMTIPANNLKITDCY